MIKKLRFKFVAINMSIVVIMLCIILGLVYYFTRADLEQESITMMQNIANHPLQVNPPNEIGEEVRLPYFTIQLGPQGEVVATGGGYYDLSDEAFLADLIDAAFASSKTFGVIEEYNLRYYRANGAMSNCLVFADISSEQATLDNLMSSCLIIGGASFLLFLTASILLSKWAVKPVELAWQQQRQFVADASHELKTPLTVIMTNTELAQSSEYDAEHKQRFLTSIATMSQQMRGLIEQLLELTKLDNADTPHDTQTVDFSRLISDALLPFEPVFFEKGLTLQAKIEENVLVTGQERQLCQVLEILLDNAQKYSYASSTTWVKLRKQGKGHCLLTVANEGEIISAEEAQNIFKRFYRIDPARSRNGSFGLGLAIAESIVMQHGGKIWVESTNGLNSFYVDLSCL